MELLLADVLEAGRRKHNVIATFTTWHSCQSRDKKWPAKSPVRQREEQIFRIQNSTNGHLMDLEFLCYSFTALLAHD